MADGESVWEPLSVREGRPVRHDGPYEGVPDHLRSTLLEWVNSTLSPDRPLAPNNLAEMVALRLRITGDPRYTRVQWVLWACEDDENVFLDVLDLILALTRGRTADALDVRLLVGGSIWTVSESKTGLVRRVNSTEQAAYTEAVQSPGPAADNLTEAWTRAYGRHVDPSDAWDHAIKACESVLAPIITPASSRATLGSIIAAIKNKPANFDLRLTSSGSASGVETLMQMLQLIWPNPDRHETGSARRPTVEESRDVVHLAVLVVNWVRQGALTVGPAS